MATDMPPFIARLRHEPLVHLPALVALALACASLPARAQSRWTATCGGSRPAQTPASPGGPRDCDQACHIGCQRERRAGSGVL